MSGLDEAFARWDEAIKGRSSRVLAESLRELSELHKTLKTTGAGNDALALVEAIIGAGILRASTGKADKLDRGMNLLEGAIRRVSNGGDALHRPDLWALAMRAAAVAAKGSDEMTARAVGAMRQAGTSWPFEGLRESIDAQLQKLGAEPLARAEDESDLDLEVPDFDEPAAEPAPERPRRRFGAIELAADDDDDETAAAEPEPEPEPEPDEPVAFDAPSDADAADALLAADQSDADSEEEIFDAQARQQDESQRLKVDEREVVLEKGDPALAAAFSVLREARLALERRRREGDPEALAEAEKNARRVLEKAPTGPSAPFASALLAECAIERGDPEGAEERIERAIEGDPENDDVLHAAVRLRMGDAETALDDAALRYAMASARADLMDGEYVHAVRLLQKAADKLADDPWLLLLGAHIALAHLEKPDLADDLVMRAWQRFPATRTPMLGFGGALDADVPRSLVDRGRALVNAEGPQGRFQLARRGETKDHLPGGYMIMGVGLARWTLYANTELGSRKTAAVHVALADALFELQYYDAAETEYEWALRANKLGIEASVRQCIDRAQSMKHKSIDDETIVVRAGRYVDPLSEKVREHLRARGRRLREAARASDIESQKLHKRIAAGLGDPSLQGFVEKLADPYVRRAAGEVRAAVEELAALRAEAESGPAPAADEPADGGGGFFGRMKKGLKGAADKAKALAHKAQLTVRINTAEAKHERVLAEAGRKICERAVADSDKVGLDQMDEELSSPLKRAIALASLQKRFIAAAHELETIDERLAHTLHEDESTIARLNKSAQQLDTEFIDRFQE